MPGYMSVSFDPEVIAASSDVASSALVLAGANSDAASAAYCKAAAASSRISVRSAAWEEAGAGVARTIKTVTDDYTILGSDGDIVCDKATQLNLSLTSGVAGSLRNIKNVGAGPVVIIGLGAVLIDGESTQTIYQGESAQLECSATNTWVIV